MADYLHMTDPAVLAELGDRIARHRLAGNRTQAELAREAGISKRTLIRLEGGESTQLTNLVRVLRALELLGNLEMLVPGPEPGPIQRLEAFQRQRRRASPRPGPSPAVDAAAWTWGDEEPADDDGADEDDVPPRDRP